MSLNDKEKKSDPELENLARRVHAHFCNVFYKIDFEIFHNEWLRAASVISACQADVETYVEAQRAQISAWIAPEDLATETAAATYKTAVRHFEADSISDYKESEIEYREMRRDKRFQQHYSDFENLICAVYHFSPTFRIIMSMMYFTTDQCAEMLEYYGTDAFRELNRSAALQVFLKEKRKINVDDVLQMLKEHAEIVKEIKNLPQ